MFQVVIRHPAFAFSAILLPALLFIAGCAPSGIGQFQHPSKAGSSHNDVQGEIFDLYSWKNGDGNWTFSLVASYPAAPIPDTDTIMSKSNTIGDIQALQARMKALGARAEIVWRNIPGPGSDVVYPPEPVMDDVREAAAESKVFFQVAPTLYQ
jgi:hypothetical protein